MKKFWVVCLCLLLCGGPSPFSNSKNAHAFAPVVPAAAAGLTAVEIGILALGTYVFLQAVCQNQSIQQSTRLAIQSMGENQAKVIAALRVWIATWQQAPSCSVSNQALAPLMSSPPFVHYQNDLTRFFTKFHVPTSASQLLHLKNFQTLETQLKSNLTNPTFRNEFIQIEYAYKNLLNREGKSKAIALTPEATFAMQMENLKNCLSDPEAWKNLLATFGYLGVAPAFFVSAATNHLLREGLSAKDRTFISTTEFLMGSIGLPFTNYSGKQTFRWVKECIEEGKAKALDPNEREIRALGYSAVFQIFAVTFLTYSSQYSQRFK